MITKENTPRFVCSDGSKHDTLAEAKKHDLEQLLVAVTMNEAMRPYVGEFCLVLMDHQAGVLDILLTDGRRRKRIGKTPAKRKKSVKAGMMQALDETISAIKENCRPTSLDAAVEAVKNPTMENVAKLAKP